MCCYSVITFIHNCIYGVYYSEDFRGFEFLVLFFLQPSDDFQACFDAALGEFGSFRTEIRLLHPPNKQANSSYLKDKFEHKSYIAFIFSVKGLYLLFDY